ncbi:hypothetical protein QUF88_07395 [Bacillus sp. DX1.1]|uniref:lipase family protein n=1 Tax=unclassified Bacillus (in: firmicutes) TaxID=185979 RepID=UPI00257085CF|nr:MULTISPECIES: hypothetical protein [unclassified Bacillus (in: firmicutes)]MDM5153658.1 hypothetical protein [Bacillus sp. DX1.1]WJE82599.1 hypothetical protein QRE67_04900 [Bacillus sp. DX3.1]
MSTKNITDLTMYELSKNAYKSDKERGKYVTIKNDDDEIVQSWKVHKTFHDKQTGMDAVVFEREVNGKTQVMVAFRGTEGDKIFEKDSLKPGEGMKDALTDGKFFIKRDGVHDSAPAPKAGERGEDPRRYWNEENRQWEYHNQFEQAEKVMEQVKEHYKGKNVDLYVTGHSLGGALAEYVAAFEESVRCLSWNAPSAKHLLPPDLQERADNGEFKDRIVSIVHGSDTIGYGPFGPYDGHIGSTYSVSQPPSKKDIEALRNLPPSQQLLLLAKRFQDSISGPGYHYQDKENFQFGKDGNLSNSYLLNVDTGERVYDSPGKLLGGGEIRVVVEHLEEAVRRMKQNAQEFQDRVPRLTSNMMDLLETAESKRLEAKITNIRAHVEHLSFWYIRTATEISNFIEEKVHAYKKVDGQE